MIIIQGRGSKIKNRQEETEMPICLAWLPNISFLEIATSKSKIIHIKLSQYNYSFTYIAPHINMPQPIAIIYRTI